MVSVKNTTKQVGLYLVLAIVVVWVVFPFFWAWTTSIKTPGKTLGSPFIPFLQFEPTLNHWRTDLSTPRVQLALMNSIIVASSVTGIVLLLGTLAAYSLARYRFKIMKNKDIILWFLSQQVMPPAVILIPLFILFLKLKLNDTRIELILVNVTFNLPFVVIIMREMFRAIPPALEEAAFIDGASEIGVFFRIGLPLVLPGLAASGIIAFSFTWNETMFAVSLTSQKAVTMPVLLCQMSGLRGILYWFVGVRTLLVIGPPVVLVLLIQKYLVTGLSFGAIKG